MLGTPIEFKVLLMEKSLKLDNQQVTQLPFKVGWLVGMIEAEGTVGIYPSANYKGKKQFKPALQISNTDLKIINRTSAILRELGIPFYITVFHPSKKLRHKTSYLVKIGGYKRIEKFFQTISPKLFVGKKRQAEIVEEFIKSRLNRERGWQFSKWGYSDYELNLVNEIKTLNQRGVGSRNPHRLYARQA